VLCPKFDLILEVGAIQCPHNIARSHWSALKHSECWHSTHARTLAQHGVQQHTCGRRSLVEDGQAAGQAERARLLPTSHRINVEDHGPQCLEDVGLLCRRERRGGDSTVAMCNECVGCMQFLLALVLVV